MRILFLVRSLDLGGAERQMVAVARGLRDRGHQVSIAVFYGGGPFEAELRAAGISVHDLRKRGRWEAARFLARLAALVHSVRPDVLHAYMEANVFAAAVKPLCPRVKVLWGIRTAKADLGAYDRLSRLYPLLERAASRLADGIIVNSDAARRQAIANGLDGARIAVVPNGIDCEAFRPDAEGRARTRARWGIGDDRVLVGLVARLDPVKDHPNFIRAAARVAAVRPEASFVCIGNPSARPEYRRRLGELAIELGLGDRLTWVEEGKVSREVYGALDVAVLSSGAGESFPNVLGEAMACGKATVTTDSGDAAAVVGDTGAVAPVHDDEALARGILSTVERLPVTGPWLEQPRARIESKYSVESLARRTEEALARFGVGGSR